MREDALSHEIGMDGKICGDVWGNYGIEKINGGVVGEHNDDGFGGVEGVIGGAVKENEEGACGVFEDVTCGAVGERNEDERDTDEGADDKDNERKVEIGRDDETDADVIVGDCEQTPARNTVGKGVEINVGPLRLLDHGSALSVHGSTLATAISDSGRNISSIFTGAAGPL